MRELLPTYRNGWNRKGTSNAGEDTDNRGRSDTAGGNGEGTGTPKSLRFLITLTTLLSYNWATALRGTQIHRCVYKLKHACERADHTYSSQTETGTRRPSTGAWLHVRLWQVLTMDITRQTEGTNYSFPAHTTGVILQGIRCGMRKRGSLLHGSIYTVFSNE